MRIAVFSLVLGLALPGYAMDAYSWRTESGGIAYTDDAERIPSRYAGEADRIRVGKLSDYERLTISKTLPPAPLRDVPAHAEPLPAPAQQVAGQDVLIEVSPGVTIPRRLVQDDEPIRVERRVYRWEDGLLYPYTLVKQGDRLLLEIREEL